MKLNIYTDRERSCVLGHRTVKKGTWNESYTGINHTAHSSRADHLSGLTSGFRNQIQTHLNYFLPYVDSNTEKPSPDHYFLTLHTTAHVFRDWYYHCISKLSFPKVLLQSVAEEACLCFRAFKVGSQNCKKALKDYQLSSYSACILTAKWLQYKPQ